MNISNFFISLLFTLTFSFNATATIGTTNSDTSVEVKKVEGGPRTVIQAMTDVVVLQPTTTTLYITIVNSEDNAVISTETEAEKVVISLSGLEAGTYTVETIDDNEDYQEFYITVQ